MLETHKTADQVVTRGRATAVRRKLRWFFPVISGVLLAALVIGFAPSFFFRGRFNLPFQLLPIPPYLIVHGIVLTTWYVLVFTQTCLVAARRTLLHRRLGVIAVGVAVLLVPISALVVVRAVPRLLSVGVPRQALYGIILGDFVALFFFSILVAAAVHFRRSPDVHKRLMVVSCSTIYGPVPSRWGSFYGLHAPILALSLTVMFALAIYDVIVLKRLHPATLWGAVGTQLAFSAVMEVLIRSGAADEVITALQ